ncbi:MAG: phosphatase PAP2 family protein [Bacteroidota bacterium]|nr:phosphatase PAP2 family protein [Bacteroidota bacterium]
MRRYILIMLGCYAVWVGLYYLTGWIGELRGEVFHPAMAVDAHFPFVPQAMYAYLLAYVIVLGLYFVRRSAAFLNRAYLAFITMNLLAFALFALFPSQGPVRSVPGAEGDMMLTLMYSLDARWNAFPSLHVANPWLVALLAVRERRLAPVSIVMLFVALGISVSTLLIRQHYLLDVLGGFALAVLVFVVFHRLRISDRPW